MQLLHLFFFITSAVQVRACIRVHVQKALEPWPSSDHIYMEIWDKDNTYFKCKSCGWSSWRGEECKKTCGHFVVKVNKDFGKVEVYDKRSKKNYWLQVKHADSTAFCCVPGFNGPTCRGTCNYEWKCWDSGNYHRDCRGVKCKNCDKQYCGRRKRGLLDEDELRELANVTTV